MIELDGVEKRYDDGTLAVTGLDMAVARGELVAMVGPSGCGKSTILRMVNRLVEPTAGTITVDGQDVTRGDAVQLRRRIGYVIQAVGLFPHLTVAGNVASVPDLLGWDRARTAARTEELLELVGLPAATYARRYPHELSGGQRQRIGVARALAAGPPVLLMDEPFGAVDPIARGNLQTEFRRIQQQLGTTVLLVTHDVDEAVRMADRIAVFGQGGVLQQLAPPTEVLGAPANDFVADFVGADRGLLRLAVTPIEVTDLVHPPVVLLTDTVDEARRALGGTALPYAVVLDRDGVLRGWVSERLLGEGAGTTVAARAKRFSGVVGLGEPLRRGLAEIVQHDAGWLPVLDGQRYVGVLTPEAVHAALRRTAPQRDEAATAI